MWMVGFNHVNNPAGLFTQHNEKIIAATIWKLFRIRNQSGEANAAMCLELQ